MGASSGSDSGSSSQTSSFDYESEAAGISNYAGSNFADGQGDDRISFDYEGDAYGTTPASEFVDEVSLTSGIGGTDYDSTYNASDAYFTPSNEQISLGDRVIDYVKGGGLIGVAARKVNEIFNPTNQYEGITGEDGYGEGDYISTVGDWAESRGLTTDYSSEDLETQAVLDKQAFDAGFRTQSFKDLYDSGDSSNLNNLSTSESEAINSIIPQASYVVSGQEPIESQVNKFFESNPTGMGLS